MGYSPRGHKEFYMTEQLTLSLFFFFNIFFICKPHLVIPLLKTWHWSYMSVFNLKSVVLGLPAEESFEIFFCLNMNI